MPTVATNKVVLSNTQVSILKREYIPEGIDAFKEFAKALPHVKQAYADADRFLGKVAETSLEVRVDHFNTRFQAELTRQKREELFRAPPGVRMRQPGAYGCELAADDEKNPGIARQVLNDALRKLQQELFIDLDSALLRMSGFVGRVQKYSPTVSKFTYFRHVFTQERKGDKSVLTHVQEEHLHQLRHARIAPVSEERIPQRIQKLVETIPGFLRKDIRVLSGMLLHHEKTPTVVSSVDVNNVPQPPPVVRTEWTQTYSLDPALIHKDFVLAGWEADEK